MSNETKQMSAKWSVHKNGEQVSKKHSTKMAAIVEAYEMGAAIMGGREVSLAEPYSIKKTSK
jgi:hypothetical protein